jgi:UDP-N-acetylglucosamine 4,6-dehydratase/5-epimerase
VEKLQASDTINYQDIEKIDNKLMPNFEYTNDSDSISQFTEFTISSPKESLGKVILITGGTGTMGHALTNKLRKTAQAIRIFSRDEYKQKKMSMIFPEARYFVGDVRDKQRLNLACEGVDYIIHCAALKHIDTALYNPFEIVKTNILGTQNVIDCAMNNNAEKVVLVSTDKACEPINLYGSSKLCAEKMIESANNYRGSRRTEFKYVRYGNVFGSRGSVVEIWKHQNPIIVNGHMTRFHITLPQAVALVEKALSPECQAVRVLPDKLPAYRLQDLADAYCHVTGKSQKEQTVKDVNEKKHEKLNTNWCSEDAEMLTPEELQKLVENYIHN